MVRKTLAHLRAAAPRLSTVVHRGKPRVTPRREAGAGRASVAAAGGTAPAPPAEQQQEFSDWIVDGYTCGLLEGAGGLANASNLGAALERSESARSKLGVILGPDFLLVSIGRLCAGTETRSIAWVGGGAVADHLPRAVLCLYAADHAVVSVRPRSQYLADPLADPTQQLLALRQLALPAGSLLVCHANLVCRLMVTSLLCVGALRVSEPTAVHERAMRNGRRGWAWAGRWPSGSPATETTLYRGVLDFLCSGAEEPGRWTAESTVLAAAEVATELAGELVHATDESDRIGAAFLLAAAARRLNGGRPLKELVRQASNDYGWHLARPLALHCWQTRGW